MEMTLSSMNPELAPSHTKACVSCVRAKAKCVPGAETVNICQRCHRLQKPCEPSQPRPRTQPRKRKTLELSASNPVTRTRVSKLEEKLDGIVTLLKATHESASPMPDITSHVTPSIPMLSHAASTPLLATQAEPRNSAPDANGHDNNADIWDERLLRGGPIRQRFALLGAHNPVIDAPHEQDHSNFSLGSSNLGIENAEQLLHIFKNEMNPSFPFISIPESTSAEQLRQQRPSLFTAVMAVTSRDSLLQGKLGNVFMQQLADRVLITGERNLDLVLAIVAYTGWCCYHFYNIPRLTCLINLATTVVGDLGLLRHIVVDSRGYYEGAVRDSCGTYEPRLNPERTMEEQRAILGYWFISSVISSFFHRFDAPKWTPYLEDCRSALGRTREHRDDRLAVSLVKVQLMAGQIKESPWHDISVSKAHAPPPALYMKSLEGSLKALQTDISHDLGSNIFLDLTYKSVEISLYKIGLSKNRFLPSSTTRDFQRMEILFACQQAVKYFFEKIVTVPVTEYHCMPIHCMMQLTWNMGVLQMLSTFDHPEWNLAWMRESLSFSEVLQHLVDRLSKVKEALNFDPDTTEGLDMFSQSAKRLAWIKTFIDTGTIGRAQPHDTRDPDPAPSDMLDLPSGGEFMEYMDDAWMRDLLGSWEQ